MNKYKLYLRSKQACLERPDPPNLVISIQALHLPQSGAWQTWMPTKNRQ